MSLKLERLLTEALQLCYFLRFGVQGFECPEQEINISERFRGVTYVGEAA